MRGAQVERDAEGLPGVLAAAVGDEGGAREAAPLVQGPREQEGERAGVKGVGCGWGGE